jgi:hypothetical protein
MLAIAKPLMDTKVWEFVLECPKNVSEIKKILLSG